MNISHRHFTRILQISLTYTACVLFALLCEWCELPLAYGLTFSLTSVPLLVILVVYGLWPGIAGAAAVYLSGIFLFNEPYTDLIGILEIAVVGLVLRKKRGGLLLWDTLFQILIAVPVMSLLFYFYSDGVSIETKLIMILACANGLFNALTADILTKYMPLRRWSGIPFSKDCKRLLRFSEVLFHFSIAAAALPFLFIVINSSLNAEEGISRTMQQMGENMITSIKKEIGQWGYEDIRGIRLNGRLQIGHLQQMVDKYSSESLFQIVITDSQDRILAGNDPRFMYRQVYDWRNHNRVTKLGESYYRSVPIQNSHILQTEAWKEARYVYEDMITHIPLQIYISMPIERIRTGIYAELMGQFSYLLLFLILIALMALYINRGLARNLARLAHTTTGIVDKLRNRNQMEWPSSNILELRSLIENFRHTSENLAMMFHESLTMNDKLQEQTAMLRRSEEKLHHLAYYDMLTGLPNRLFFAEHLQELFHEGNESRLPVAVMFADLNRFKQINDTLGHAVGDSMLQTIGSMYQELSQDEYQVFRLGGDEFVFVIHRADETKLQHIIQRIFALFEKPVHIGEIEMYVTVSLGVSLYPRDGEDLNTIVKHADIAMYAAKEKGGNSVHFFDEKLNDAVTEKMLIDNGIRQALNQGQFSLHYQPKIHTASQRICGLEALIRWRHPELGLISPAMFIPLAEESGMILEIDEWVLREACRHNKAWQDAGLPKVPVAVNISGRHFYQDNLFELIRGVLEETALEGAYLIIEITEGVLIKNVDQVIETIKRIKELGVEISIDDFGTGYSSLNQLQRLPIYQVKLDRSFISDVAVDIKKSAIVKAVIELAHSMSLQVVAEGIETAQERDYLVQLGCDELQGYYYSKPVPFAAFAGLLSDVDRYAHEKGAKR